MFENQELPVSPAEVDFALLTHAHIDHSGKLPLLAKKRLFRAGLRHGGDLLARGHHAARLGAHPDERGRVQDPQAKRGRRRARRAALRHRRRRGPW